MTQPPRPPAIFLMGPTASGKTALAGELMTRFPVELISVDAAQVYRGMDIGTAKPSPDELRRMPHHLIDIRSPDEAYSAADFRADALRLMAEITARGRIPLLVGGTFLYFRALERGLSDLPAADPEVRARILVEAQELGWDTLHARLRAADPASAARIHPNDPQRLQRALELMAVTGKTPSELYEAGRESLEYHVIKIIIAPSDRHHLAQRIDTRFRAMLTQGLVEEARRLFEKYRDHPDISALRTVGYRQAGLYLTGKINYDEMVKSAIAATRQYAKRQLTWLRAEAGASWFDSDRPDLIEAVSARIAASLGNDRYTVP